MSARLRQVGGLALAGFFAWTAYSHARHVAPEPSGVELLLYALWIPAFIAIGQIAWFIVVEVPGLVIMLLAARLKQRF
jgi:hypothetical protein